VSGRSDVSVGRTAELIEDAGEAAVSEEFFRSREFLDAEGVTHTLRIASDEGELLAPLIVRDIPGSVEGAGEAKRDAISPYGYPGVAARHQTTLDPAAVDFSQTGLISIFLRHSLGSVPLAGARDRNVVQIADPALPLKSRGSDRNQVNKNRRAGYEVRLLPGPETSAEDRAEFLTAYEQTMRRTEAAAHYYFSKAYFDRLLESDRAWLALVDAPGGGVAAGSIAVQSDGFIHYYLSGSTDEHLRDSPMKNVVTALIEFSSERGLPLNLGGGISRGDRLEEFKRGFANREEAWSSSEIVCDAEAYARLSPRNAPGDFFPAYRAT
jgi:hypothetical protein